MSDILTQFPHLRQILGHQLPLAELGPGRPVEEHRAKLERLSPAELFAGAPIKNQQAARACLAGIWLLFDFLDESHAISQEIGTVEGSYWHGIMHRREPDYGNAKYWFRRVPEHPIFAPLAEEGRRLAAEFSCDGAASFLVSQQQWSAERFVDLCEFIERGRSSSQQLAREVACAEWQLLFAHCYRQAL